MNDYSNFVEYVVEKKVEGTYLLQRLLVIIGYIVFALLYFILFTVIIKMPALIAPIPLFLWIIIFFTWRYVSIEYEYSITSGIMTVSKVFGMKSRKQIVEIKLKDMSIIAPYEEKYFSQINAPDVKTRYNALSSFESPDSYFAIFTNEKKEKSVLFFEATNKTLTIAKFYNSSATVMSTSLRH